MLDIERHFFFEVWPAELDGDFAAVGAIGAEVLHGGHDGDGGAYLRAPVGGEGVLGVLAQAVEGDEGGVEEEVSGNVSWTVSGEFEFGLERASTYKTYHAANLECARVVQYSSIERMVSFAASRHLNTAKLSVLEELRSL